MKKIVDKKKGGLELQVRSRFTELNKSLSEFNIKDIPNEDRQALTNALKRCVKSAFRNMLPLSEEDFQKHGYKRRIRSEASSAWRIGYASGATLSQLLKVADTVSISYAKSTGGVTFNYKVPEDIVKKLANPKVEKYNRGGYRKSTLEKRKRHRRKTKLKRWTQTYKKDVYGLYQWVFYKFGKTGKEAWSIAFAIINSWRKNGGKPKVMRPSALRITLNNAAKIAFREQFSKEIDTIRLVYSNYIKSKLK